MPHWWVQVLINRLLWSLIRFHMQLSVHGLCSFACLLASCALCRLEKHVSAVSSSSLPSSFSSSTRIVWYGNGKITRCHPQKYFLTKKYFFHLNKVCHSSRWHEWDMYRDRSRHSNVTIRPLRLVFWPTGRAGVEGDLETPIVNHSAVRQSFQLLFGAK